MKNSITIFLLSTVILVFSGPSIAQLPDSWTQKSDFGGVARYGAVGFSIGTKGYIGTGYGLGRHKDFWEFDPATNTWSQKADFGGTARFFAAGFSIGAKGYIGTGNDGIQKNDFWEYNPTSNSWTKKADFGGIPRDAALGFSIGSKGYMGTGELADAFDTKLNDFWEYDPATDTWTQKANVGTLGRSWATGFSIGIKGYIGTGSTGSLSKSFFEYNPETDTWTSKANFGGVARFGAIGCSNGSNGFIGLGDIGGGFAKDFWEYDPGADLWVKRTDFGGHQRTTSVGFSIDSKVFVGSGFYDPGGVKTKDFWEYTPFCIPPAITTQPTDQSLIFGTSASFAVIASDAVTYKWQEDSGSGFSDITNGGIYSNSTSPVLNISLPAINMSGYKYRCIVTGDCIPVAITNGNATLFIAAKPIVITAVAGQSKEYGDADPAIFAYTVAPGLIGTDVISGEISRSPGENAGLYIYTLGNLTASPNYLLTVSTETTFSITPKDLNVEADNKIKCFDSTVFTGFTVTYSGFVSGEDQGVLAGTLAFGGSAVTAVNPGSYEIIPSGLSSANYALNYVHGTLDIFSSPTPTISGPNSLCAGSNNNTYATEPGFTNYVWTISYGGIITGGLNSNSVTVDWGTAGSRSISVNYQNTSGCYSILPETYNVLVKSIPVPQISGQNAICSGTAGVVYTTQVGYENYIWEVSSGGTLTFGAGTNSITVDWTGSGNQIVSVDFTNELGCQSLSPTIFNVDVAPLPASSGPITGPASVCAGVNSVVFSVSPISNAVTYYWNFPSGATIVSGAGTSSVTVDFSGYTSSGLISVSGVNDCGSGPTSPGFNIQVNPVPASPVITQHGDTLTSSSSSGNQWYLDDVEIIGATGQQHIAVYIGTYHVEVTLNECVSEPSNSILVLPVSTKETSSADYFHIYPNPSTGSFNLNIAGAGSELFNIEIYNSLGALIWKKNDIRANGKFITKVDMESVPAGLYTVALRTKSGTMFKKLIISR